MWKFYKKCEINLLNTDFSTNYRYEDDEATANALVKELAFKSLLLECLKFKSNIRGGV